MNQSLAGLQAADQLPELTAITRLTVDSWVASQADGLLPYGFDFMSDTALEPNRLSAAKRTLKLGGAGYLSAPRMGEYGGAFLAGIYQPVTRADTAGHCLSAMVANARDRLGSP